MSDFGIKIVKPGTNIKDTSGLNMFLFTKYYHMKLDTQLSTSFRDITFTFNTDPPEDATTTVYTYAHGYTYVPSFWSLIQVTTPVTSNFYQPYFQSAGVLSEHTAFDSATFYVYADATNIYFKIVKVKGAGSANPLTGCVLDIRVYVFADGIV